MTTNIVGTLRKIREQHSSQLSDELIKEIDEAIDTYENTKTLTDNIDFALKMLELISKAINFIENLRDLFS